MFITRFKVNKTIQQNKNAYVGLAVDKQQRNLCIVKRLSCDKKARREFTALEQVRNCNPELVASLQSHRLHEDYEIVYPDDFDPIQPESGKGFMDTIDHPSCVVMTYSGSVNNLPNFMKLEHPLTEKNIVRYMKPALQTLVELENKSSVVHCDIKPQNMVYNYKTGLCTLVDFGLSQELGEKVTARKGSPLYMAPEAFFSPFDLTDRGIDMWGFGVMLYQYSNGIGHPFSVEKPNFVDQPLSHFKVSLTTMKYSNKMWCNDNCSNAKDLVQLMMNPCSSERIPASEAIKHPLFTQFVN
ncbi:protein kinase [Tetraselmis virus 1]|uniref:non-specific serine/threonine protein kinase n=1 Tax=Tetraselmis virus 1 TaxID=2060617 RepID=A0A2P0VN88_9VIRU|nr:protein kinase [Tetraselmis virus 1]AUF82219.1 protein kinase [Tetraselmis virus 1]